METPPVAGEAEKAQPPTGVLTSDEKFRAEYANIDPKEERKLVRKLDFHIVRFIEGGEDFQEPWSFKHRLGASAITPRG